MSLSSRLRQIERPAGIDPGELIGDDEFAAVGLLSTGDRNADARRLLAIARGGQEGNELVVAEQDRLAELRADRSAVAKVLRWWRENSNKYQSVLAIRGITGPELLTLAWPANIERVDHGSHLQTNLPRQGDRQAEDRRQVVR